MRDYWRGLNKRHKRICSLTACSRGGGLCEDVAKENGRKGNGHGV